ncbi:MAG: type II toxin-antitoxin system MqsA family antitoxin [Betaproteobacteria bacterium]|nr:type II toxin-antitoxin system MqsA family antitoxin [Betaproteobacteria bacterium]
MKCPICKHGHTREGSASITLERDGATLVFKDVPAEICANCGEIFHDETIIYH